MGIFSYAGTKERIIVSKDYSPKVPFFQGIGAGIQNKYQWARSITSWFILLQAGVGNVTTWYFYYGIKDTLGLTTEQQGVLNGHSYNNYWSSCNTGYAFVSFFDKKNR